MSAKSTRQNLKTDLKALPHDIYRKKIMKTTHPSLVAVMQPRDCKQVRNTVQNEREKNLPSKDDIIGLHLINEEIPDFIQSMQTLPDFIVIISSKQTCKQFEEVSKLNGCTIFYDTTFNLGDFYVSALSYKHPLFQGGPVIPLMYHIHHFKKKEVHQEFFRRCRMICPSVSEMIIVTDREAAIIYGIKQELPSCIHIYCWNHIQRDVKHWVEKKKNSTPGDVELYVSHIWDLLDSDDLDSFGHKLNAMSVHWSAEFKNYFSRHLLEDIKQSAKWVLLKLGIYTPRSGITQNAAESFNEVLKRFLGREEVKLQVLVLSLYRLDMFYQQEITRGFCGLGNYVLCDEFVAAYSADPSTVAPEVIEIDLEKIPYIFENRDFKVGQSITEKPCTTFGVAKLLVMEGKVTLVPQQQAFLCTGPKRSSVVKLFPKQSCTCNVKTNCQHIMAALLSIGADPKTHKEIKLSTLLKKKRGSRSGRKKNPQKVVVVEAADDSTIQQGTAKNTIFVNSLLLPTISSTDERIKMRFAEVSQVTANESTNPSGFNEGIKIASTPILQKPESPDGSDSDWEWFSKKEINKGEGLKVVLRERPEKLKARVSWDNSVLYNTFTEKFNKNKAFVVHGRSIYPKDLNPLVEDSVERPSDLYFNDSLFDVYFSILIQGEEKNLENVTVFPCEGFVVNYIDNENAFLTGMHYFFRNRVPEKDIILFPITYRGHCTLIILLKKQKTVAYLDSLGGISVPHLSFIMKLWCAFCKVKQIVFDLREWIFCAPKDIPLQNNSYDCGAYCCLFAETLIRQSDSVIKQYHPQGIFEYRRKISRTIRDSMQKTTPPAKTHSYRKEIINKQVEPDLCLDENMVLKRSPGIESPTVDFLAQAIKQTQLFS